MARTKSGWGASRANLLAALAVERLTGVPQDSYQNAAMIWGTEQEPQARIAYAFHTDNGVTEVGFIPHPRIAMSGASPDGCIGKNGLLELKCPGSAQHIETLLGEPIADKYILQVQWQMACTDRAWCDWVSFDPRMPPELQLFVKRIDRDHGRIRQMEEQAKTFLAELDAKMAQLNALLQRRVA